MREPSRWGTTDPAAKKPVVATLLSTEHRLVLKKLPLAQKVEEPGATNRTGPSVFLDKFFLDKLFLHELYLHELSVGIYADDYDLRYSPRDARPRVLMGATSFQAVETEAKDLIP